MKLKLLPWLAAIFVFGIQSCSKDREYTARDPKTTAIWVLSEGTMGQNNGTLNIYDVSTQGTATIDLGETPNDIQQYGSKIYCVISGTQTTHNSFVKVFNVNTRKQITSIDFNGVAGGYMPRSIAFHGGKAYVSAYDGTIRRIDTASLSIDKTLADGGIQEGIAIVNNKLYVANSDHYLYPTNALRSVLTIVDLPTFTTPKHVTVNTNPQSMQVNSAGNILLATWGNANPASVQVFNTADSRISSSVALNFSKQSIKEDMAIALISNADWSTSVKTFNQFTGAAVNDFITDNTSLTSPYGLNINEFTKEVFLGDAKDYTTAGAAYIFGADGKLKYQFTTGTNPKGAVFVTGL